MKRIISFSLSILATYSVCAEQQKLPLNTLHEYVDVLNIEGGIIPQQKHIATQKWFNIATILDRPFIDGIEFDDWTNNNKFYLKESSIPDYNELQVYYIHISAIDYCIKNAHKISQKNPDEMVTIVVHSHRGSSGVKYLNILKDIMENVFTDFVSTKTNDAKIKNELFAYHFGNNVSISFRYGYKPFTGYESTDIIISLSLVAGFNKDFKSGDNVIPNHFIPMNLDTMEMHYDLQYAVNNYFFEYLNEIISSQSTQILRFINAHYSSPNDNKKDQKAKILSKEDFKLVKVVEVNKNFNPSTLDKYFSKIDNSQVT